MAHRLRPVELDFAGTAPCDSSSPLRCRACPAAVYGALAEDVDGLADWFTAR